MRHLRFAWILVFSLEAVLAVVFLAPAASAQGELLCDLVHPPTVVISVQGALISCASRAYNLEVYNASKARRIEFAIARKNVWPLTGFTLSVPEGANFTVVESASGEGARYLIEAAKETFSRDRFALNWDVDICFCMDPIGCDGEPVPVSLLDLAVFDAQGKSMPSRGFNGSLSPAMDAGVGILEGRVYYSDGTTPAPDGFMVVLFVDGIKIDPNSPLKKPLFSISPSLLQQDVG